MKKLFLRLLLLAIPLCLQGCATRQQLTLAHDVNVPKQYRTGNFSDEHPGYDEGNSAVERYVNAYERGWSYAVQRFATNIDLDDPSSLPGSGWIEEVDGYTAGYADGRDRIELLIPIYGKQKVSAYLQQFRPEFPDEK